MCREIYGYSLEKLISQIDEKSEEIKVWQEDYDIIIKEVRDLEFEDPESLILGYSKD